MEPARTPLAGGQLFGVLVFFGLGVPQLICVPQTPAVHEDLAVAAGSLGHQTPRLGQWLAVPSSRGSAWPSGDRYSRTRAPGTRSGGGTQPASAGLSQPTDASARARCAAQEPAQIQHSYRYPTASDRQKLWTAWSKDLARIEDAVRIERRFNRAMHLEHGGWETT